MATTQRRVQFIEPTSVILAESPATYQARRQLLAAYNVEGVAVHDARLVAMMQTAGINHILSLNARDWNEHITGRFHQFGLLVRFVDPIILS